ncbi:MAG TPA: hypothetical protein VGB73_06445 [Pyrinomonadaceae bacterium]|jgi:hypothetical protein
MAENVNLDEVRGAALERIERSERNFKLALYSAVAFEMLFLVAFMLAADFSNRLHVLLIIATVGGYTIVVLGLVVLGAHMSRGVLRILKAVELLRSRMQE